MRLLKVVAVPFKVANRAVRLVGYRRVGLLMVGAAAGAVLSPVSGSELRRRIAEEIHRRRAGTEPTVEERVRQHLAQSPRTWHLPQPEVVAVTRRIRFPAMMSHGNDSWGSFIIGVQPDNEQRVSTHLKLGSGRFVHAGTNEIVISRDLADKRGLALGDEIVLLGSTVDGSFNGVALRIVGVLSDDGLARFYSSMAYVPIDRAKQLIGLQNGEAYDLVVRLRENAETTLLASRFQNNLPILAGAPLSIETWRETGEIFHGILRVGNGFRLIMAIGLGLIISVLVFTSLSVFIHERNAEISTMQAIGYQRGQLLLLFVSEGVFVTAMAAIVGLVSGSILVSVLRRVGIPAFNEAMTYVFAGERLYPVLRAWDISVLFFVTVTLAFAASLLPAWRAAGSVASCGLNRI